jgi:type VI secretion system protein ImpL
MNVMAWLWIGLSVLGAIILAAVVWLAGPLVSIGDAQPFDSALVRLLIILAIVLGVAGAVAWRIVSRRRAAAKIAAAMTETVADDSDAPVLKQ